MIVKNLKKYFAHRKDVVAVYLFGSHAKGMTRRGSDVDVAVLFKKNARRDLFGASLKISTDLMQILNYNRVDVVVLNTANPVLRNQVYKYGVLVLCNNPLSALRFKARTILEYLDLMPARRLAEIEMRRRALAYGR